VGGEAGAVIPAQRGGEIGAMGPYPVGGRPGVAGLLPSSSAYSWTGAQPPAPMTPLPEAQHADRDGLGGMLDEAVIWALEKSGLMKMLEKVTGNLAELNAAADAWQVQAKAVQNVAEALRSGARSLPGQWEGDASDAFGQHMGEVVEALDSTAEGMARTAEIIGRCAQECAMAEGMVVEIISEAIEVLIASLAAEAVIAVFTAGIGLIADALITEGEIAIYVARVARVSTELATKLEKLLMELKKLGSAVKAVRSLETAKTAVNAFKEVKVAVQGIREFEEGGEGLLKAGREAFESRNFDALKDAALRAAVGKADGYVTGKAEDAFGRALGIEDVQRADDLSAGGLARGAGQGAWGAAKEGLTSDTNVDAVKEAVAHGLGMETEPEPYRVDLTRIQQAFG
jgi:WXG100 family type VII secretion target